jgi:hypothetical protein
MTTHKRRLAQLGALAILLMLVLLVAPAATPAQSDATETPVPPTGTADLPSETPTSAPTETAAPTETPMPAATTVVEPPKDPATSAPLAPTAIPTTAAPIAQSDFSAANHTATISPTRTTVNNWVTYTLANYPSNATVHIQWQRNTGNVFEFATATTDATGAASGRFRVPAVTGGPNQNIFFVSGVVTRLVTIEVRPRIKVLTNPAVCGQPAEVSLRGYAKNESVRIRWKVGDSWTLLTTVVTSNTGSANVSVIVPAMAAPGANSVRGDGTIFRQQTNVAFVQCAPTI